MRIHFAPGAIAVGRPEECKYCIFWGGSTVGLSYAPKAQENTHSWVGIHFSVRLVKLLGFALQGQEPIAWVFIDCAVIW